MSIKNKFSIILFFIISFFSFISNLYAGELNISASEIVFDKDKNLFVAKGSVTILDSYGNEIYTDRAEYESSKEYIKTYENSELLLKEGYKVLSSQLFYDVKNKMLSSNENTELTDPDGNIILTSMFEYSLIKSLFSSEGNIKIIDIYKNKYFFDQMYIDTKDKKIVGSNVKAAINKKFGVNEENDPRFAANSVFISENKSNFSKGVFTICKKRGEKCPPWQLQAKKISHDKVKKTIYYDHAVLKIYDLPLFYFPKFFHPDPTVKRQSGFLPPSFTDSTTLGKGFGIPYFWAISQDKDITFTPRIYKDESLLFINEFRQAFEYGSLILDTSYTEGYKDVTTKKTPGSRNHIFAKLNLDFGKSKDYESKLLLDMQKVSNDTYFRIHDINTALVDDDNTDLKNEVKYSFKKNNMFLDISAQMFENLRETSNKRYEYIAPNINFGNTLFSSTTLGTLDWKTNSFYRNYDVNKKTQFVVNDFTWNSKNYITKSGFVNAFTGLLKNSNYEANNTSEFKNDTTEHEIAGVLSLKSSLPMQKDTDKYFKLFSPHFMIRYAPGHMRDLSSDDVNLSYSNLFNVNKTNHADVIEKGLSTILGFDYNIDRKMKDGSIENKLSLSGGQVFTMETNKDLPSSSTLDQKMSDLVGEITYNFNSLSSIDYKFALDHNFNTLNYNEISSNIKIGMVNLNLDYLEERNHIGNENYISAGITLELSESNSLLFSTKKNYKTDSTEFYNMEYQYQNDCLKAGIVFNREFYEDRDVGAKDTLMFKITILPFGGLTSPSFRNFLQ